MSSSSSSPSDWNDSSCSWIRNPSTAKAKSGGRVVGKRPRGMRPCPSSLLGVTAIQESSPKGISDITPVAEGRLPPMEDEGGVSLCGVAETRTGVPVVPVGEGRTSRAGDSSAAGFRRRASWELVTRGESVCARYMSGHASNEGSDYEAAKRRQCGGTEGRSVVNQLISIKTIRRGLHGRGGLSWGEQGTLAGGDGGLRASLICDNMLTSALGCSTHPTA